MRPATLATLRRPSRVAAFAPAAFSAAVSAVPSRAAAAVSAGSSAVAPGAQPACCER